MKILRLSFTNLNSLQGSWEIDFTHASFASEGIFAITGRTGAGKSTILDAICLALFGQTPRLKVISASTNDIMSRHTGECSAEVDFSTHKGSYRASWYQNRARKKIDGALQQPKHTLAELETETFLTEKTTDTVRAVEEITGLNFTRFTRSVLLAQGSFAAFLQARDDERSDVLEQLTGTEIYSDISIAVYNQTKEERVKLERLQESVQALRLLSPEERETLEAQLGEEEKKRNALQGELERLQGAANWFKALSQLQEELTQIEAKKGSLAREKEAFLPLQQALALAHKALELDAPYTALTSQRLHLAELKKESALALASLAEDEKKLVLLAEQRGQAETSLSVLRKKHQEDRLVHSKVRELDIQLEQQVKNEQAAGASLENSRTEATEALRNATAKRGEVLAVYETALALYCRKFVRSSHEILKDDFWPMERLGQKIIELLQEKALTTKDFDEVFRQTEEAEKNVAIAQAQGQRSQQELEREQKKLEAVHLKRERLFAGEKRTVTRGYHDETQGRIEKIQEVLGLVAQPMETAGEYHKQQKALVENTQAIDGVTQEIEDAEQQVNIWREKLEELEKTSLVLALQGHRNHLAKGQPCPLCGSLEHPYREGALLESGSELTPEQCSERGLDAESGKSLEATLAECKAAVSQGEGRLGLLQGRLAEARGRGKVLLEQRASYEKRFGEQLLPLLGGIVPLQAFSQENYPLDAFSAGETALKDIADFPQLGEKLREDLQVLYEHEVAKRKALRAKLDEGEGLDNEMEALNRSLVGLRATCDINARGMQEATIAVEGLRGKLEVLRQKQRALTGDLSGKIAEWRKLVCPLGHTPSLPQNFMSACLDTLPPVPSFLVADAEVLMQSWLHKNQSKMLEALGSVTPPLGCEREARLGEARQGENGCQQGEGDIGKDLHNLTAEQVEGWLGQLLNLRERWLELDTQWNQNRQRLETILPLMTLAEEGVQKIQKVVEEQEVLYEAKRAERKKTLHERHVLFGEQRLEDIEKTMNRLEGEADERLRQSASRENAVLGRIEATRRQSDELMAKMQASEHNLSTAEGAFKEQLAAHDFADEEALNKASLHTLRRKELETQAQELASRQIELEGQEREKKLLLKEKQQQPLSEESEGAVVEKIGLVQNDMRQCGENIGSLREKIEHNAMQERQRQGRLAEIAAQQIEFGRWETLNALIGHSEGKKFRRFAQGLTFEAVVSEANTVLARLSERYTLLRDKENPLELNVCDSDQAGEIRSTRNLSGGESFIVSLALALGLSSMASRTVRLDSLFLDEGFGALDEDSLDVALDVLASLPDDGKVIGIISHVSSLKERIRKSIQVIPMAGGRSRLEEGEGVKAL